jgi:O-acetyl-ADP-ribose deacetylase (regulator of RNase III)
MSLKLEVKKGDITRTDTEAIVNAANNKFWMGSGVAGAIKNAGGQVIEEEAVKKGPVMPGEAVYTGAGQLRFKYVIHAAVMGQDLRTSDRLIRRATIASLKIADELKLTSVALPAFGTGVGGFPMKACAHVMTTAVNGFESVADHLERVQFCIFDDVGFKLFQEAVDKLQK